MGVEIFLIDEAFATSYLLILDNLGFLVFFERVEMFGELGSLGWNGIVEGNVDVESARSLESIIKSVGVICGSE
jgi:hypothetical protein